MLLCVLLSTVGCGPNIIVTSEGIGNKSVEVNVVGVNKYEYSQWESMSMDKYWSPDNPARVNAKRHIMKFGQNLPVEQILERKNPLHKQWKARKVEYLFILADLPGIHEDQPGSADARRLILPWRKKCWKWKKKIEVSLESNGINCFTLPKCDY